MFKCPKCNGNAKTTNTYHKEEYNEFVIYRRFKCLDCGTKFFTKEIFERFTEDQQREDAEKVAENVGLKNFLGSFAEDAQVKASVSRDRDRMTTLVMKSKKIDWDEVQKRLAENGSAYGEVGIIPPEVQ